MLLYFCHLPCHAHVCYKAVHPVTQCLPNVHERYRYKKVIISYNFFFAALYFSDHRKTFKTFAMAKR